MLISIIVYLLILNLGYIVNKVSSVPTGKTDIINIDTIQKNPKIQENITEKLEKKTEKNTEENTVTNNNVDKNKSNNISDDRDNFEVSDDNSEWNNKTIKIFSNPVYEFKSKIAPGSSNSYSFALKNNNDFDVVVDFNIIEENPYNINMKYRLKQSGKYIMGNILQYVDTNKLNMQGIKLKAKETKNYILEWKWIDSENDTKIGETMDSNYKLTIKVKAKSS